MSHLIILNCKLNDVEGPFNRERIFGTNFVLCNKGFHFTSYVMTTIGSKKSQVRQKIIHFNYYNDTLLTITKFSHMKLYS